MLGPDYRFSVNNQGGVNVGVVIQARPWKFDTDGSLIYGTEFEVFNESAIASSTSAWTEYADFDNATTDKWLGLFLEVVVTPSASATGLVQLQVQYSTDGGTTWPGDGFGVPVASTYFAASSTVVTLNAEV